MWCQLCTQFSLTRMMMTMMMMKKSVKHYSIMRNVSDQNELDLTVCFDSSFFIIWSSGSPYPLNCADASLLSAYCNTACKQRFYTGIHVICVISKKIGLGCFDAVGWACRKTLNAAIVQLLVMKFGLALSSREITLVQHWSQVKQRTNNHYHGASLVR